MRNTYLIKILMVFSLSLVFFTNVNASEEDADLILNPIANQLDITASINETCCEIILVRMYNLYNPYQFTEVLVADECNNENTTCYYSVLASKLVKSAVYRIELTYSNNESPIVVQYIHN